MLLAAIYILSRHDQSTDNIKAFLGTGAIVVGFASIYFVWSLHFSMAGFRVRLRYLYNAYFDKHQRENMNLNAADHYIMTFLLSLVCFIASAFTFFSIIKL